MEWTNYPIFEIKRGFEIEFGLGRTLTQPAFGGGRIIGLNIQLNQKIYDYTVKVNPFRNNKIMSEYVWVLPDLKGIALLIRGIDDMYFQTKSKKLQVPIKDVLDNDVKLLRDEVNDKIIHGDENYGFVEIGFCHCIVKYYNKIMELPGTR